MTQVRFFDLNRRMFNFVRLSNSVDRFLQDDLFVDVFTDDDVTRQHVESGRNRPNVQVVYFRYTVDRTERIEHVFGVDRLWRSFH